MDELTKERIQKIIDFSWIGYDFTDARKDWRVLAMQILLSTLLNKPDEFEKELDKQTKEANNW